VSSQDAVEIGGHGAPKVTGDLPIYC
jgi:hypothetical protein